MSEPTKKEGSRKVPFFDFPGLMEELKALETEELRFDGPDYFEAVFSIPQLEKLHSTLRSYFGDPFKRAGEELQNDMAYFMERFGGVRFEQFLYFYHDPEWISYAMIWPWGDRTRVTLRAAKIRVNYLVPKLEL